MIYAVFYDAGASESEFTVDLVEADSKLSAARKVHTKRRLHRDIALFVVPAQEVTQVDVKIPVSPTFNVKTFPGAMKVLK